MNQNSGESQQSYPSPQFQGNSHDKPPQHNNNNNNSNNNSNNNNVNSHNPMVQPLVNNPVISLNSNSTLINRNIVNNSLPSPNMNPIIPLTTNAQSSRTSNNNIPPVLPIPSNLLIPQIPSNASPQQQMSTLSKVVQLPPQPRQPNHNALHSYSQGTYEELQRFFASSTSKTKFLSTLYQVLKHNGDEKVFHQVPKLGGNFVDLFNLYRVVDRHGGYESVSKRRIWHTVAKDLNISTYMDGACNPLKKWYESYLRSFEEVIRMKVAKHQSRKAAEAAAAARSASSSNAKSSSSKSSAPTNSNTSQPPAKRPRVDPPASTSTPNSAQNVAPFVAISDPNRIPKRVTVDQNSVHQATSNIRSNFLGDVVKGLNYLNQASMEPDNTQANANRSPFYIDQYPLVILALGELLEKLSPYASIIFPPTDYSGVLLTRNDSYNWNVRDPMHDHRDKQVAALKNVDNNKLYLSTLNIIRNISFEVSNAQLITYSAVVVRHLISLLLLSAPSSCMLMEAASLALDVLLHTGGFIDISGNRRMKKILFDSWMTNPLAATGNDRDLLLLSISPAFSPNSKDDYTQATSHLLPTLFRWLRCDDRSVVLRVVRVIGRLGTVQENLVSIDMMCPDEDLGFLVQLLCTSESAVDSLDEYCSATEQLPSRLLAVPNKERCSLNASITEDFNDFCDIQMRDAVLETLLSFCSPFSATLKERVAAQPRCISLISRIVLRSSNKTKQEGNSKEAIALLSALASEPRNRKKILPVLPSLTKAAFSDDAIADLMTSQPMRNLMRQPQFSLPSNDFVAEKTD